MIMIITLNVVEFSGQLIKRLVYVSVYFLTVVCHVLWALLLFRSYYFSIFIIYSPVSNYSCILVFLITWVI